MRQAKSNWLGQQCPKQIAFLSLLLPPCVGPINFHCPFRIVSSSPSYLPRWVGTLKWGRLFWSFSVPFFLEWKPGGVNLNGMPLGETPLDSKFGLAHASKKEDRRTVFEASSRKSELWKTSFNDPLTCDSHAQASKTSEPQCHIASLKRVLSL